MRADSPADRPRLAVFDIDGTLLDPAARTRAIFLRALRGPSAPPHAIAVDRALEQLPLEAYEYAPEETLRKVKVAGGEGLGDALSAFLLERWRQDFLSDAFLEQDREIAGAAAYVATLHRAGVHVVYLTGRNAAGMLRGTISSLQVNGFPVGVARTVLLMKPRREEDDLGFKRDVIQNDLPRLGEVVAVYENEPENLNALASAFPKAAAFYVDTKHRKDVPVDPRATTLDDYRSFDGTGCAAASARVP